MEKKFGVFNTVEELNKAAADKKDAGDLELLIELAEENGLDRMDAEDYFDGTVECLCTPLMAAIGKLDMEGKDLNLKGMMEGWKDYIVGMLSDSPQLSVAVFNPDKKLLDVLAIGLKAASDARIKVDMRIINKAGLPESAAYMGDIGRDEWRNIVNKYYLG